MNLPMATTAAGVISYLAGSVPFGYIVGRVILKRDIRKFGSGNIGATNVARVLGKSWGVFVLLLDALKGALPVLFIPQLFTSDPGGIVLLRVVCGIATVVGHMFPIWLKLKGGKGVATGLGVALVLSWQATLAAFVVFLLICASTRLIALGSMLASVAFCATYFILIGKDAFGSTNWPLSVFAIAVPTLILVQHRSNIARLLNGTEPRFGDAPKQPDDDSSASDKADKS